MSRCNSSSGAIVGTFALLAALTAFDAAAHTSSHATLRRIEPQGTTSKSSSGKWHGATSTPCSISTPTVTVR